MASLDLSRGVRSCLHGQSLEGTTILGQELKSFSSPQVSVPLPVTSSLEKYGSTEQQLDKLWRVTSDLSELFLLGGHNEHEHI